MIVFIVLFLVAGVYLLLSFFNLVAAFFAPIAEALTEEQEPVQEQGPVHYVDIFADEDLRVARDLVYAGKEVNAMLQSRSCSEIWAQLPSESIN